PAPYSIRVPYTTLFRSQLVGQVQDRLGGCPVGLGSRGRRRWARLPWTASPNPSSRAHPLRRWGCRPSRGFPHTPPHVPTARIAVDRKSTRLNSSHQIIP